jgi:MOSC domain-containing protein YiiM
VGDRLTIGTAEFAVTQPRMPCFKLTFRFRRSDMVKHFLQSGRPGFYLAVVRQGTISAGQRVTLTPGSPRGDSIAEIARRKAKAKANDAGDA